MARTQFSSPTLTLQITEEARERAIKSSSGGCLIADAIREQYPNLSGIVVDMATVRVTDRKSGLRYTYLTPPQAQHCLLSFDQGWSNSIPEVVLKKAVKIDRVKRAKTGPDSILGVAERRTVKMRELEAKEAEGTLTRADKISMSRLRNPKPSPERPSASGPRELRVVDHGGQHGAVILGGHPLVQGQAHKNLLRGGRNRHFGAKLADPGVAWREALAEAVADQLTASKAID